ncbi:hypothetical protein [Brevibacillus migulae]|uniref:hypothetical protein n=1 Tax=Brevibacillus migulae TaxID=1644114 RepID=UPI0014301B7C|nr:hypothetical protein [Brevibacillus migulae]
MNMVTGKRYHYYRIVVSLWERIYFWGYYGTKRMCLVVRFGIINALVMGKSRFLVVALIQFPTWLIIVGISFL